MRDHTDARATDLESVFDAHVKYEFVDHDVDATMRTMVPEPYLLHVPTLTGGVGGTEVRRFYERHFVGKWPADTKVSQISRTVGTDRFVDELILRFTHKCSTGIHAARRAADR
jgi:carboxymethylenebutenolidase